MYDEPNNQSQAALLERRVGELDDRLRTIEAWSAEMYQYQSFIRPRTAPYPPAPRWQPQPITPPSVQPAAPPSTPYTPPAVSPPTPVFTGPFPTPSHQPFPATPPPLRQPPPLWQPVSNLYNRLRATSGTMPTTATTAPAGPPPGQPASAAPATPSRGWSLNELEQLLSGRGLAWVGGLAILLGAIFFLGLAFTRGWIGPAGRVGIGLIAGGALIAAGAWFFERREALFGHVLLAVGLGTTSFSLLAATRLYHLFPTAVGLAGALIIAGVAATVAIRAGSQIVAGYSVVAALAAPPLLGADANLTTIAFLAVALTGTTAIALHRTWNWLPALAFVFAAPQLAAWLLTDAALAPGLVALAGFWALNTLAAGGEEFRIRRDRLSATAATLLVATAGFLVATGFGILDRMHRADDGGYFLFLLVTAGAYGAIGAYFLRSQGENHGFGLLATGTAIAALTMAIPIQFGGPIAPIAWAAEAAALAWVYARRGHRFSGVAAMTLGALATQHLLLFEYPFYHLPVLRDDIYGPVPFIDAAGTTLGFLLLAFAVAAYLLRNHLVRAILGATGFGLAVYALPFETGGVALVAGWAALFVLVFAIERAAPIVARRIPRLMTETDNAAADQLLRRVCAAVAGALATLQTLAHTFAGRDFAEFATARIPFRDDATLAVAILVAASLLAGALARHAITRRATIIAAFGFAAFLLPFELRLAATVVGWSALALGLCAVERRDRDGMTAYLGAAGTLSGIAAVVAFGRVAPLSRLAVHARGGIDHPLLLSGATAALGSIAVVALVASWWYRAYRPARWLMIAGGAVVVCLLSVGIVDEFQRHISAGTARASLVNLQKQAQVALSIFWATLGGAAFIVGLIRRFAALRLFGLALLSVATVKVFLFDLASLDATYKVPSLIGLGVLLLASSYVYQRLKPRDEPESRIAS